MSPKTYMSQKERYAAAARAAAKEQEAAGVKPAPLSETLTEEQKKELEAMAEDIRQQREAQEKRKDLAQKGDKPFDELENQLRPGNRVKNNEKDETILHWFVHGFYGPRFLRTTTGLKGDKADKAFREIENLVVETGIGFEAVQAYECRALPKRGGAQELKPEKEGLTYLAFNNNEQPERVLVDGSFENIFVNLKQSTDSFYMQISDKTLEMLKDGTLEELGIAQDVDVAFFEKVVIFGGKVVFSNPSFSSYKKK